MSSPAPVDSVLKTIGRTALGALQVARELGPGKVVATVAVDTGLKYLAGDLYQAR